MDYLLKPIAAEDVRNALLKLECLRGEQSADRMQEAGLQGLLQALKQQEHYKTHFLIPQKGDKLLPLAVDAVYYFYIIDGNVKAVTDGREYALSQTLDEIADSLPPAAFFPVNREYQIARRAIKDIDLWFNSRLSVNLTVPVAEKILVSKVRVAEFKEWFTRG